MTRWNRYYQRQLEDRKSKTLVEQELAGLRIGAQLACEIIEEYPTDPRGPSCLTVGFSGRRPIHAVCALKSDPEEVLIITVYDPSKRPEKWTEDYRKRKE